MPAKLPVVRLNVGRSKRLLSGHPWVYSNEVQMDTTAKAIPPGSAVRLVDAGGVALGVAAFNPHTLIAARVLTRDAGVEIDRAWLTAKLRDALSLRERLFDRPYYRLVHAEADGLPGLIVDRFGDVVTVQSNSMFIETRMEDILAALDETIAPKTVILRNDSTQRALEGLAEESRVVKGTVDGPITLEENGAIFFADPLAGQKTGWFYDQRDNRAFISSFAGGGTVVDFFSYNGGFAVLSAIKGARSVIAVDRSQPALDNGRRAAEANGVADRCEFRRADAFNEMERMVREGEQFDVVIADPPAFVKSKKDIAVGCRAYRKMSRLAAQITKPGGFLLCASCSHNVDPPTFAEMVSKGLNDAGRTARVIRQSGAGSDHPVHPHLPESAYLKGVFMRVD